MHTAELHAIDRSCLAHLLGYQVVRVNVPARRAFEAHIGRPLGLRPVEFTLLVLLAFNPGASAKQLAQTLSLAAPAITLLLDRLSDKGLVERVRSESDRRTQHLHLTAAGARLARRAHDLSRTIEADLLRPLSAGERAMLLELLHKVARHNGA